MSEAITFSVIIPAYNAVLTIVACIESVLAQSQQPHEIIVVDDAGTDATATLIRERFSGLVQLIVLPHNGGPSIARNAGMNAAKGTHVCFLDADDVWHSAKLAKMTTAIKALPGAGLWFHSFTIMPFSQQDAIAVSALKISYSRLLLGNMIAPSCAIIHSTALRFDAGMRFTEDYDFFLRICWRREIVFLNEALTQRSRPLMEKGGQSSRRWKMRLGEMRSYSKLVKLSPTFLLLFPFLIIWSLLKHARLILRRGFA